MGKSGDGPFSARFGRRVEDLEIRLMDYLHYKNIQGSTVILSIPNDIIIDRLLSQALTHFPDPENLRPNDPRIIVHSTTTDAWRMIRSDGQLGSALELHQIFHNIDASSEVSLYLGNEPPEYSDYIMFNSITSTTPEKIVASYQAGRFVADDDAVYEPGVRLYCNNHNMIMDNPIIRDGLHITKVHKRLQLSPYLLAAIGVEDMDPQRNVNTWSIRSFTEKANEIFSRRP